MTKDHPPYLYPPYQSTVKRSPVNIIQMTDESIAQLPEPSFSPSDIRTLTDLTKVGQDEALGERIIVYGRVSDDRNRPLSNSLLEIWQCNSAGRYQHEWDDHNAPLDPNFYGTGRAFTDRNGFYKFVTIKPGAYPWKNHKNAWRPAHIHFSIFGKVFGHRLITQMYFPGDPLLKFDPIFNSVENPKARDRMVSAFELEITEPNYALGYRFDIVVSGKYQTPFE